LAFRLIGKIYATFYLDEYQRAKLNYEKACLLGNSDAMYELALLEIHKGNRISGISLMKSANKKGHVHAKTFLSINVNNP
jgi:TPR repeat protein